MLPSAERGACDAAPKRCLRGRDGATARSTSADLGWRTLHTQGRPALIIFPPL